MRMNNLQRTLGFRGGLSKEEMLELIVEGGAGINEDK